MDKVKSRDFLLSTCGILLLLISILTVVITVIKGVESINDNIYKKKVLSNIYIKNSSLKLYGNGNFVDNNPSYKDLVFSDYKVKFKNYRDSVLYTLKLCNDNDVDVKVLGFTSSDIKCNSIDDFNDSCQKVLVDNYILDGSKKISNGMLKAKSCYKLVIDAKYEGELLENDLLVYVDKFDLKIEV